MKSIVILPLVAALSVSAASDSLQSVAILPFRMPVIDARRGATASELFQKEIEDGYQSQRLLYESLKNNKRNAHLSFRDPLETNRLLVQNDITFATMHRFTAQELGQLLGSDAVISIRTQGVRLQPRSPSGVARVGQTLFEVPNNYGVAQEGRYRYRAVLTDTRTGQELSWHEASFILTNYQSPYPKMRRIIRRTGRHLMSTVR